jgi:replicative DNA helicase
MQNMTTNPNQLNQASQVKSPDPPEAVSAQRIPPQSLEAEMCTLGSMILDVDCIGELVPIVKADHFYRLDHHLIFEAILKLYEDMQTVDLVLLRDELKRRGQLDQVGKVEYLVRLAESVPSSANAAYYARIVRDQAMLRSLISVSTEICSQAYEAQGEVAEIVDEAEQKIFEITQQKISGQAVPIKEIMSQTFELIDQRRGSHVYGLATGFRELDELTGGLQNSEMIVVAARPSMGKTALGLNMAEYVGADSKQPVAVFSLEMAAQQLAERMLCGRAQIDSQKLRKSILSDQEIQTMHDAAGELSEAKIYVDDSPSLTPLELRAKARRLKLQYDIELIVIDYLQLMHAPGSESRQMEVTTISRHLKAVARELNIPVVVMSQLNRSPEGREGHRPRMSDLRESGSIEQDADVVILLHREDYYHTEEGYENTNTAEIIVAKQRNGPTGPVNLIWNPHWTRFLDLSHVHAPDGIDF